MSSQLEFQKVEKESEKRKLEEEKSKFIAIENKKSISKCV
jgi:hypothetical protein